MTTPPSKWWAAASRNKNYRAACSAHVRGMPLTPNPPIAAHRARGVWRRRHHRQRHSMPGAATRSAEPTANVIPCRVLAPVAWNLRGLPKNSRMAHAAAFSIFTSFSRTAHTTGAATFITSYLTSRFRLHASDFVCGISMACQIIVTRVTHAEAFSIFNFSFTRQSPLPAERVGGIVV